MSSYQARIANYLQTQNAGGTVGDITTTKHIAAESLPYLSGALPYTVTQRGSSYDGLPSTLRWSFRYQVDDVELLNKSLPALAGHSLALSFNPASPQDEQVMESYVPAHV